MLVGDPTGICKHHALNSQLVTLKILKIRHPVYLLQKKSISKKRLRLPVVLEVEKIMLLNYLEAHNFTYIQYCNRKELLDVAGCIVLDM